MRLSKDEGSNKEGLEGSTEVDHECIVRDPSKKAAFPDDTNPDVLIGGTNVVHCKSTRPTLHKKLSIFADDEDDDQDTLDTTPLSTLDSAQITSISDSSQEKPSKQVRDQSSRSSDDSHKIFTFSLPFGGKPLRTSNPITSLVTSLLPNDIDNKNSEFSNINKEEIKRKLRRSDSITSLEEMALFNDEKGIDNVRARAFKKTFEMESLKQTLKSITAAPGKCTHDGYEYTRLESIWDELEGDFLLMGGYRGSILRDAKTKRRLWIPIKAGLNLRKVDLRIGPDESDEEKTQKEIIPDRMLSHIGPVDISKRLMKKLKANPKNNVTNYGYDWRLSLHISAELLKEKLQNIYDKQEVKKGTYVIAHSMGGLVAHKVLQEHTHLIRGLIYVGSPSQCSNILGPLKFGDEVLMNKTILSKEANFFMRSSFYFLPVDGSCFVNKDTLEKYELDFFDPQVWVDLSLSPLVDNERNQKLKNDQQNKEKEKDMAKTDSREKPPQPGISTDVKDLLGIFNPVPMLKSISSPNNETPNDTSSISSDLSGTLKSLNPAAFITKITASATDAIGLTDSKECQEEESELTFKTSYDKSIEYLERTLKKTKTYLNSLDYIPNKTYPPLVIVYGNCVPTVRGVKINSWEDVRLGRYDDFFYGPGDGVVHHKWLLPEHRGFPVEAKISSSCGHVSLLSDLESMAKAFISIIDNEKLKVPQPTQKHSTCI